MAITEVDLNKAKEHARQERSHGYAVKARYDRQRDRVVVTLNTGIEITFPTGLAEGLADATPDDLTHIEITPGGLGLHWPAIDADLYVPGLLAGRFGNRNWAAAQMGARGGSSRSEVKAQAARANGRLGGRPRKRA